MLTSTIIFIEETNTSATKQLDSLAAISGISKKNNKIGLVESLLFSKNTLNVLIDELDLIKFFKINPKERYPRQKCQIKLKNIFNIKTDNDNAIVHISVIHWDPQFAEKVLLHSLDILDSQYKKLTSTKAKESYHLLGEQIKDTELSLNEKLDELHKWQRANNVINPLQQLTLKSNAIAELEMELQKKTFLRQQLATYQGWNNPQVQQMSTEIKQLQNQIVLLVEGNNNSSKFNLPVTKLIDISTDYSKLTKEIDLLEKLYISQRVEQYTTAIEKNYISNTFQIIEKPNYYTELAEGERPIEEPMKYGPSRGKLCILITFLAFCISTAIAITKEFLTVYNDTQEGSVKLYQLKKNLSLKKNK